MELRDIRDSHCMSAVLIKAFTVLLLQLMSLSDFPFL